MRMSAYSLPFWMMDSREGELIRAGMTIQGFANRQKEHNAASGKGNRDSTTIRKCHRKILDLNGYSRFIPP
jgi:hypothetical protein